MSQKMISCTKSKFHGFYASDTECPWCDKKQQDETAKTNVQSDKSNVDYWPSGKVRYDGPAVFTGSASYWYNLPKNWVDNKKSYHTTGKDHTLVPPARELTDKSVD